MVSCSRCVTRKKSCCNASRNNFTCGICIIKYPSTFVADYLQDAFKCFETFDEAGCMVSAAIRCMGRSKLAVGRNESGVGQ